MATSRILLCRAAILAILLLILHLPDRAAGQEPGQITGTVTSAAGEPAPDAEVTVVELRRRTKTGPDGGFRIENVRPGTYLLEIVSPRYGNAVQQVAVHAGGPVQVDIQLEPAVHLNEVVVSVSPEARGQNEAAQPVEVLSDRELQTRLQPTLGETLAQEPGVTSTYFGPGASRPVIRGLGGDRIRILENGIGVGDASSTSPDHAVSADPLDAERIEIVRGPATLLYGSSAEGGVVNVIDNRIPDQVPDERVSGQVDLRGGTVANERSGNVSLTAALAPELALHGNYLRRETDDFDVPRLGELDNSQLESKQGSVGLSYVREAGYIGASFTGFDTDYGIPPGREEPGTEEGEEEGPVTISMRQRRGDARGEIDRPFAFLRALKVRFGATDYEHTEFDAGTPGTKFTNNLYEGRLEAPHRSLGPVTGAVGVQFSRRDFEAAGEEAFVPPTRTDTWSAFAFEEVAASPQVKLQLGARYENQDASAEPGEITGGVPFDRSLDAFSASAGLIWAPAEDFSVALSGSRAIKLPNAEELFSNGPHDATGAFEIGDIHLREEKNLGLDLTLRKTAGRVAGSLSGFLNRFDDFIFEEITGELEDDLQVIRFVQRDADFIGGEAHLDLEVLHRDPHHVTLELSSDYVRAELRDTDEPLPRIPPLRGSVGVRYQGRGLWASSEVLRVDEQDRVAPLETTTPGYTFLNASLGYRFFLGRFVHDVMLTGRNLTDEFAQNHVSFLKDRVPLPGRNVSLSYRLSF
jgi:iron complex outermembrane receptor protein